MKPLARHVAAILLAAATAVTSHAEVHYDIPVGGICYNLDDGTHTAAVTINPDYYSGTVTIPATVSHNGTEYAVTAIEWAAFRDCAGLTSVTIPASVTVIGDQSFQGCTGLTSVTIPTSVTTIGRWAFCQCENLISVSVPGSVTVIDDYAFATCSSLPAIDIPESVTTLGINAFGGCSKLESVTIPNSISAIAENTFRQCFSLTSITIPNSVTSIGASAFAECSALMSVSIPASVTSIGENAFALCTSLKSAALPESLAAISDATFADCYSLESVTIPASVTAIGTSAFHNCFAMADIHCNAPVPPECGDQVFANIFKEWCTLHVPAASVEAYRSAPQWNEFIKIVSETATPDFEADGLIYHITDDILHTVAVAGHAETLPAGVTIPASVTFGDTEYAVTAIGEGAFRSCTALVEVTIGNSVVTVGKEAFKDCVELEKVIFGSAVETIDEEAFSNTTLKKAFWLESRQPTGVSAVQAALNYVTDESLADPVGEWYIVPMLGSMFTIDNVTYVPDAATTEDPICYPIDASYLPDTGEITIPGHVTHNDVRYFVSDVDPDFAYGNCNITKVTVNNSGVIYGSAFHGCMHLSEVTIGDGITYIGPGAFMSCHSLTKVTLGNSVTVIEASAFHSCEALTEINIPESVTNIGDLAFHYCLGLTDITLPPSITEINYGTFASCTSLKNVSLPESLTAIGSDAFYGCSALTQITIPDAVTVIGDAAFSQCTGLTELTLPASLTTIGRQAFLHCQSLTVANVPGSVTELPDIFSYCTGLTDVTIGNAVATVGEGAFEQCTSLKNFTCLTPVPPICYDNTVFGGVNLADCVLHVPAGSESDYQNAPRWREFGTITGDADPDLGVTVLDTGGMRVSVSAGSVTVGGVEAGQAVSLFSIDGMEIGRAVSHGADVTFTPGVHGIYIVAAGNRRIKTTL